MRSSPHSSPRNGAGVVNKSKKVRGKRRSPPAEYVPPDLPSKGFPAIALRDLLSSKEDMVMDKLIELNVSGKKMTIQQSVLCKYPSSMLAAMFSGRHRNLTDSKGRVYVGRPAKPFKFIISWLQTGVWLEPADDTFHRSVMVELDYFGLTSAYKAEKRWSHQFLRSKILHTDALQDAVLSFCNADEQLWRLIYRGTRDGFESSAFHERCDSIGVTLTIVQTTKGFIFGGYTDVEWDNFSGWKESKGTWLFSVRNGTGSGPTKLLITNPKFATYNAESFGPTFGGNYDLYISNNCNEKPSNASSLGHSFAAPMGNAFFLLEGESTTGKFQVEEMEVYSPVELRHTMSSEAESSN